MGDLGGAIAVEGHGVENLDYGFSIDSAVENGFLGIAQEMFGEVPEVEDEGGEHQTEELDEEQETSSEEEEEEEAGSLEEEEGTEEVSEDVERYYVVTTDDGEELEVEESELLSGYLRKNDYSNYKKELEEERSKIKEDLAMLQEERSRYSAALNDIIESDKNVLKQYEDIDWAGLRQTDPNQFLLLRYEMEEARTALQQKLDARESILQQSLAEKQVEEQAKLEREGKRVAELVEGWGTQELKTALREQSIKEGFTEEDESLLSSAMVINLLNKARAYDELKAKASSIGKKKQERIVPKMVKSGGNTRHELSATQKHSQDAFAKLKSTGRIQDSISIFENFI